MQHLWREQSSLRFDGEKNTEVRKSAVLRSNERAVPTRNIAMNRHISCQQDCIERNHVSSYTKREEKHFDEK